MKKELWLRLRDYHFTDIVPTHLVDRIAEAFGGTDASTKAFASKIARKHGWSSPFALRAINEYRKFVFLGVTGDTIVTPSKVIDTVWHEHLLFTRAYREFCQDILQRDFDHHPELLPSDAQTDVYAQQFAATIARYRSEFNVRPPWDIWGTPKFKREKEAYAHAHDVAAHDSSPLYQHFNGLGDTPGHHDMPEFSADASGDSFAGGGGGSDWGSSGADGSSSGDSGSSDGGGSGCSSGCGGD